MVLEERQPPSAQEAGLARPNTRCVRLGISLKCVNTNQIYLNGYRGRLAPESRVFACVRAFVSVCVLEEPQQASLA